MAERGPTLVVGRYALYEPIAAGGMATVYFGRLLGPVGFSRTVAIKRLHPQFASNPSFVAMFLDEARMAARVRHSNVLPTLDVVDTAGELFLVMEYCAGETLSRLMKSHADAQRRIPLGIVITMLAGVFHGLHAAHEAKNERGEPLCLVHRDVSPQNILVGTDGVPRVLDFGVAKAIGRSQETRERTFKGKLSYMSPEQLYGEAVDRQTDVYAASVVLWEVTAGRRLFDADNEGELVTRILNEVVVAPAEILRQAGETIDPSTASLLTALDEITLRGLSRDRSTRFATARDIAIALERLSPRATASEVAEWVELTAPAALQTRANKIAEIESGGVPVQAVVPSVTPSPVATASLTPTAGLNVPPGRKKVVLGAIVLLAATVVGVALYSGKHAVPDAVAIQPIASEQPAAASLPLPLPSALASVEAAPSTSATTEAPPLSRGAPRHSHGTPARGTKDGCSSPTFRDSQGFVHFKPECM